MTDDGRTARTLIKYHRCARHQNPLLRLRGWHCWRCRRAFGPLAHYRRWRSYRDSNLLHWYGPWWAWNRTRRQR